MVLLEELAKLFPDLTRSEIHALAIIIRSDKPLTRKDVFLRMAMSGAPQSYSNVGKILKKLTSRRLLMVYRQEYYIGPGLVEELIKRSGGSVEA